jgi:hypothetical protein
MSNAWWDDGDTATAANEAAPVRDLVPEGLHDFTIKQVIESEERVEVRLVHDDKSCGWVFDRLNKGNGYAKARCKSLAGALGIAADRWQDAVAAGDLEGRRVRAEIWHKVGNDGRTFVNVSHYKPTEQASEAAPAARPAAAKPKKPAPQAVDLAPDDIPF